MFSAVARFVLFAALVGTLAAAPAKPLPTDRFSGVVYVSVIDAAEKFGMKLSWSARSRNLVLTDGRHRVDLTAENREVIVDGLRVYFGDPVIARGGRFYISSADFERRLTPLLRPELCSPAPRRPQVIAIDPGHGGIDNGAENPRLKLKEKAMTFDVALRLKKLLEMTGYRVVLVRDKDFDVPKPHRAEIANLAGADLFISIHFNSVAHDTKTHGTEIFTFPLQSQRSDESWSGRKDDRESSASPVNRYDDWSRILAESLHREVLRSLRTDDRGERTIHLQVLRPLNCPGVLVESAYLSNDAEAARVATPAFRQQISEALFAGIRAYSAVIDALRPAGPPAPHTPPVLAAPSRPQN